MEKAQGAEEALGFGLAGGDNQQAFISFAASQQFGSEPGIAATIQAENLGASENPRGEGCQDSG
jgi:hypothetical protein